MILVGDMDSNSKIEFIVVVIAITLSQVLATSTVNLWCPEKFKNMANPDFENHKHLQNHGHLFLTAPFMKRSGFCQKIRTNRVIDVHESSNFGSKSVKK